MSGRLWRMWKEVENRILLTWYRAWEKRTVALALAGLSGLMLLAASSADALQFLGCDWSIEGSCLVGICEWFGIRFRITICLG